ncbi:methyl-accepting chemotaxis protein [Paraburkholderia fungorum]|uniref:methyl-accepting chemotaxis protein n=1 Tax=Paraburkholderia fungorum TaxID=134537 RepID=UPI0038B741A0
MQLFRNMKVVTQLMLGFCVVIVFLAGLGVVALVEVRAENDHVMEFRDSWLPSVRGSLQMLAGLRAIRIGEWGAVAATTPEADRNSDTIIGGALADYARSAAAYEKVMSQPEEKAAFTHIQTLIPQYIDFDQKVRALAKERKQTDAIDLLHGPANAVRRSLENDILQIVDVDVAGAAREGQAANRAYSQAIAFVIGFIVVAVSVAIGLALFIARGLAKQLGGEPRDAATLASEIAAGNLRVPVRLKAGDRSSLMFSLGAMKEQLTSIVEGIKQSGESISAAAGEIAQGNTDLSQRTEEQAASLEETASSMEELTATVRHNADNARQATTLASTASAIAQRGGNEVSRVVETMHEISDSSAKVAEIISVIEGIAFQTNILALNAAVEAARAGEQGRGFAVVAAEVRTLAQRSATAAKEIKALIGASVDRVNVGSKLVEEAGSTINEIVRSVQRVTDIVGEISSASEEQSTGIEQVNQAVIQMDQVTQQNAALVEEVSAAAHSMAEQALSLRNAVTVFKTDSSEPSALRVTAAQSKPRVAVSKVSVAPRPVLSNLKTTSMVSSDGRGTGAAQTHGTDWQTF